MRRFFLVLVLTGACSASRAQIPTDPSEGKQARTPTVSREETTLMEGIRQNVETNPQVTLDMADEGEERFPESPLREEREAQAIRALINLQKIGSARGRSELFLQRYPNGPFTAYVANMTGMHVVPKPPSP